MICPQCGEDKKNLGAHMRFCKAASEIIADNYIKEQRLSDLVIELRQILDKHPHSLEIKTVEDAGVTNYVEITARIPTRR